MLKLETQYYESLSKNKQANINRRSTQKINETIQAFDKTFEIFDKEKSDKNNVKVENEFNFLDKFIISKDSDWKTIFDIFMLIASVYNTFS